VHAGGKVVVYTGLLPAAQGEAGLAVVMGHEIAHAFAKHGAERMTQGLLVQMGGVALSTAMRDYPEQTQNLFMQSYGIGTQVGVLLPYSRVHENEADHLGLVFMAMAGYNPEEAVAFWQRMAAGKKGARPPEILSTHPADETRIQNIKDLLPEAMQYYRKQ
jgi:predicted Zn-dependent protease